MLDPLDEPELVEVDDVEEDESEVVEPDGEVDEVDDVEVEEPLVRLSVA